MEFLIFRVDVDCSQSLDGVLPKQVYGISALQGFATAEGEKGQPQGTFQASCRNRWRGRVFRPLPIIQPSNHVRLIWSSVGSVLGEFPGKAREDAGMTQEKLSFEAELDRTYISHLENDKKSPTVDVLFRIADALGIRASDLLARVEKSQKK
jgi:DNA-binding XRE family transcriptional regulator